MTFIKLIHSITEVFCREYPDPTASVTVISWMYHCGTIRYIRKQFEAWLHDLKQHQQVSGSVFEKKSTTLIRDRTKADPRCEHSCSLALQEIKSWIKNLFGSICRAAQAKTKLRPWTGNGRFWNLDIAAFSSLLQSPFNFRSKPTMLSLPFSPGIWKQRTASRPNSLFTMLPSKISGRSCFDF